MDPHPDADSLSIVKVRGFTVCVRTEDWRDVKLGVYIEPDTLVKLGRPEFSWLQQEGKSKEWHHVRVIRLRGYPSQGLLIPAPEGARAGSNLWEQLELERWQPTMHDAGDQDAPSPDVIAPEYDMESWANFPGTLQVGENVIVREKIHGCNGRYVFIESKEGSGDGDMHGGSRMRWKELGEAGNPWASCLRQNPWIATVCRANPGVVMYGEVYGQVSGFRYGTAPGQLKFAAFDFLHGGKWLDTFGWMDLLGKGYIEAAPLIYNGRYPSNQDEIKSWAEGESQLGDHVREGVVIRTMVERNDLRLGRVQLKLVGNGYYLKAGRKSSKPKEQL